MERPIMRDTLRILTIAIALSVAVGTLASSAAIAQAEVVRIALEAEPPLLDPRVNLVGNRGYLPYSLFDNLVQLDADGNVVPGLAREWERLSPTTYRFTLHDGITTHAGNIVDAAAIVAWIGDIFDTSTSTSYQSSFTGTQLTAEVVDDLVVDVHLAQPFGAFLPSMAIPHTVYYDVAHRNEIGAERFGRNPSGTGPFRFVSWSPQERIVVAANEDYFRGPPNVDEIQFLVIPDVDTKILALETGSVDVVTQIPSHEIPRLESIPTIRLESQVQPRTADIQPNIQHPILSDIRVRRGLAHAIDRDVMVEVLAPTAAPLEGQFHESVFGFKPGLVFEYDPDLAEQLLNEAGWHRNAAGWFEKDGEVLELSLQIARGRYLNDYEMAEMLESQMRDFGVRINIDLYESAAWFDYMLSQTALETPDYELAGWFWGVRTGVPTSMLQGMYGEGGIGNKQHFYDERFEQLLDEAVAAHDEDTLRDVLWELQDIVHENVLHWPLFSLVNVIGINDRVQNVELTVTDNIRMDLVDVR
jgi:peptide/nickel transport system substrate-binding protein